MSLIPAATEILFSLGAGETVVGRTRYGVHPPAARRVPSVGEGIRPSAEMVVSRRPEAVVVYVGAANRGAIRELERLGVPTLAVRHNTLSELEANVRRLGRLVGRREAADSLVARIQRELALVGGLTASRPVRSVYYDLWADPSITVGAGSYLDSLIVLAGGRNVFHDLEGPSSQVGLEAIAARSPELVVSAREGGRRGRRIPPARRSGWQAIPAVRRGEVRVVDGDLLHRLGPRVAEAAAALAAVIHPEIAGDLRRRGFPVQLPGRRGAGPGSGGASPGGGQTEYGR